MLAHLKAALQVLAQEQTPESMINKIDDLLYNVDDYIFEITVIGDEVTVYYDGEYQTFNGENDPKLETWLQQRDLLGVIDQKEPDVDIYYGHFEPVTHWERRV